jgi:hypothetical protein
MARTLIASDAFTGSDGTAITAGGNWAYLFDTSWQANSPVLLSNAVRATTGAGESVQQVCRWIGTGTFSNDQYAKITIGAMGAFGATYLAGVVVRASADTNTNADYYAVYVIDNAANGGTKTCKLMKRVDGSASTLVTHTTTTWTNGDTVELEVQDSGGDPVLRVFKNGTQIFTHTDTDANALLTGKPGIVILGESTTPTLDTWEGGDVTSVTSSSNNRRLLGVG